MPRHPKYDDNRQTLLNIASKLFEQFTIHKVSLEDISRATGLGKATIYKLFPSKEDIVFAVVDQVFMHYFNQLDHQVKTQTPQLGLKLALINALVHLSVHLSHHAKMFLGLQLVPPSPGSIKPQAVMQRHQELFQQWLAPYLLQLYPDKLENTELFCMAISGIFPPLSLQYEEAELTHKATRLLNWLMADN
jgi:AcrR family transcriptional regulator